MPDRPDELNILVPHDRVADVRRMVTRRQALIAGGGAAMAAYVAGCGGGDREQRRRKRRRRRRGVRRRQAADACRTARSSRATCCWPTGSTTPTPPTTRATPRSTGPNVKVTGFGSNDEILAKLRAGGSKFDVISPTGYAVKTMADLGLIMPLTHELIPNMKNIQPAFTKTDYDPGNKYSVPKDYGITSFYWLTDKVSDNPTTIAESFELLKDPKFKDFKVNFLEGGTQVMALALAALGYSINSEDDGEIEEAKQLLIDVKPNVDTINSTFIERAERGEIDFGMGWNGDIRRAIVSLAKKDREMVFLVPDGPTEYWVDNWVIPTDAEHPVAAHKWIDFVLDPVNAGKEMNYHQYPVPVVGIEGVDPKLANDPVINVTDEKIQGYESQIETARGLQQRNRAYTEFKAA